MKAKRRKKIERTATSSSEFKGKRGRPKKTKNSDEDEENKFHQTDMIKNSFLKYMHDIKYSKGLVFSEENRRKLIK